MENFDYNAYKAKITVNGAIITYDISAIMTNILQNKLINLNEVNGYRVKTNKKIIH